jgi:hypothetical protein
MHVALYGSAGAALATAIVVFLALRPSRSAMSSGAELRPNLDERRPTDRIRDLV